MKTEKIVNKTPHPIYILDDDGKVIRMFPKSRGMARISERTTPVKVVSGILITRTVWGDPVDLPEPVEGTYYIVSQLVKNALPDREDLLVPKNVVRDERGNIVGCKSLDVGAII